MALYEKWDTSILISELKKIYGSRYDYSKVIYKNAHTVFTLICPEHGEFKLRRDNIDKGCSKCNSKDRFNKETFTAKALSVHQDKYDYSEVEYTHSEVKVKIWCNTHNEYFWQTPKAHLSGKGCSKCKVDSVKSKQTFTWDYYKDTLEAKYKDIIDFSETVYTNYNTKIKFKDIRYDEHRFATISSLLRTNYTPKVKSKGNFMKEVILRNIEGYDYSNVTWKSSLEKVEIICNNCGTHFMQSPNKHITGRGCPICKESGFRGNKPAQLYYLKILHKDIFYYKIGITNRTYEERYINRDLEKVVASYNEFYDIGYDAIEKESSIKREFKQYLYQGDSIILEGAKGNAELFVIDILEKFNKGIEYDK